MTQWWIADLRYWYWGTIAAYEQRCCKARHTHSHTNTHTHAHTRTHTPPPTHTHTKCWYIWSKSHFAHLTAVNSCRWGQDNKRSIYSKHNFKVLLMYKLHFIKYVHIQLYIVQLMRRRRQELFSISSILFRRPTKQKIYKAHLCCDMSPKLQFCYFIKAVRYFINLKNSQGISRKFPCLHA